MSITYAQAAEIRMLSLWKGEIVMRPRGPTMRKVISEVAERHGLTLTQLRDHCRTRSIAYVRQEAMYEARVRAGKSLPMIGRYLNRDHTTVLYGVRAHERRKLQLMSAE